MGVKKTFKKGFAQVRDLAEPNRTNTQADGVQANTMSHSNMRPEDMRRQANSMSNNSNGSANRPASVAVSFNTGPPVPPRTAPSLKEGGAPMDGIVPEVRPQVIRKPTVPVISEDPVNNRARDVEKQLPPLRSTTSFAATLGDSSLMGSEGNREPQSHGLGIAKDPGQTLGQAVEEQSIKIQEQTRDIKGLRELNYEHVAQIKKLEDELQKEKHIHAQTTQAWRKAAAALSANRQEANHKVDDDFLRALYQNIVYDVAAWVATFCVSNFEHVAPEDLRVFDKLTPHRRKYFHVKRTKELLMQSLVMHVLVELVLNFDGHGGLWWAGSRSAGLCSVQVAVEPDEPHAIPTYLKDGSLQLTEVRDYSAWKAKTALLLSEKVKTPAVENNIGGVLAEMQKVLKPFVQRTAPTAWRDLEAVISKTVALDLELNKSRALFQVHRWSAKNIAEMQFDETRMESPNGLQAARRGMVVELILAPLITKTGNADGEAFESLSLISPWAVVCYENRKQLQKQ